MAKRRGTGASKGAEPTERLTPEERRKQRKKDRASRKAGRTGPTSPWRRALLVGVPAAVVVAVVAILLVLATPSAIPCLQLGPVPVGSTGTPQFPPHNTTNFAATWCPGGSTTVLATFPLLTITVNGANVGLPSSIGRNSSYPGGVECDLPVVTHAPTSSYPSGTIYVESPWAFEYNLSTFFSVWALSYGSVFVNSSFSHQAIVYSSSDLLGFTPDATHAIRLFVDGTPSPDGPGLGIDTLDYGPNPYPNCLGEKYGTGHRILLTYGASTAGALGAPVVPEPLATGPAEPGANLLLYDSPMPHLGLEAPWHRALDRVALGSLGWLFGRSAG